ncbi:TetR/AcrR family transcriptional regulator [Falsigemmobacter faecalis]|nr:TetR/AcrR family transcriptional regulator [Falsigemmobacter faecalis]
MPRLTDDRRLRQRQRVLDAARLCFARQGFQATTMADIIREAQMSAGAVYGYFSGKHDLGLTAMDQEMARLTTALEPVFATPPAGGLRAAVQAILDGIAGLSDGSETDFCRMAINAISEARRDALMQEALLAHLSPFLAQLEGLVRIYSDTARPDEAAKTLFALILGQIIRQSLLGGPLRLSDPDLTELAL